MNRFVQFDLPQIPKRKPGVYEQFLRFKDFAQGSIDGGNFMSREMGITFEGAAYGNATVRPARFQHLQQYFPFLWQQAAAGHAAH